MLPWLATLCLGDFAACSQPWHTRPCLSTNDPRTAAVRREWALASDDRAPWGKRICALEGALSWFRDYTDKVDEPACRPEVHHELQEALLDDSPMTYSRLQLARVVAVGTMSDITDVMPEKAQLLIRLAELDDGAISDYTLLPGERGPAPNKGFLRELARYYLARSNLFMNVASARRYILAHEGTMPTARERLPLARATMQHFSSALWGHPKVATDNGSFAILERWLDDAEARLDKPFETPGFELLLLELEAVGYYAERFHLAQRARQLIARIVDGRGEFAACGDSVEHRRDLYVTAAVAAHDLAHHASKTSPPAWYQPAPERRRFQVGRDAVDPVLYGHGFDCRGRPSYEVLADDHLEKLGAGHLPARPTTNEGVTLARSFVNVLAHHPEWIRTRPATRDWLLEHVRFERGGHLPLDKQVLAPLRQLLGFFDPATPSQRDLGRAAMARLLTDSRAVVSTPPDVGFRALDHRMHGLHVLGRYGVAFGLGGEVDQLLVSLERNAGATFVVSRSVAAARAMQVAATFRPSARQD